MPAKITPKPDDVENVSDKAGNARYRKAFEYFLSKSKDEESESEAEDTLPGGTEHMDIRLDKIRPIELISRDYVIDKEDTSI